MISNFFDLDILMVCCWIVKPDETVQFGWVPERTMYTILNVLSENGKYEVFATYEGGGVAGHLMPTPDTYCSKCGEDDDGPCYCDRWGELDDTLTYHVGRE